MSGLKIIERQCVEELFEMASGYVLDFSNASFAEFFRQNARVDIYANKYAINGDSKAKRLRAFIEFEGDALVGKMLAELLEYWRYKHPRPSVQETRLAERVQGVAERLLGKTLQTVDSEEELLKRDFGQVSIKRIPSIGSLQRVLEARLAEANKCSRVDSPLAVIFLCGSVLEGLLLGVAIANPQKYNQAPSAPTDKAGSVKQFQNWTLAQLIDVSCELGYLKLDVMKFSHGLRDFRNYIHPYQQMSAGFDPDKHTAAICLQVLKAAIASLSGQRS